MTRLRLPLRVGWLLLAAALFVRAVVPQGYMPERSAGGAVAVALCGSGGTHLIPLGKPESPAEKQRAEPPCAFAGLASPALPPPAAAALAPRRVAALDPARPGQAQGAAAAPHVRPPVRGPPFLA